MLHRFQGQLCLIAEDLAKEPLAYMLAISVGLKSGEIFVWQFASNFRGQRLGASISLASYIRKLVKKHGIERITFTAVPDSPSAISIASLADQMFGRSPTKGARLPKFCASEREFHLLT
jgi:hypothetical protein